MFDLPAGSSGSPSTDDAVFVGNSQPAKPVTPPDLIPARMLNEFSYCPRLCYLEWVQGEFARFG